MRRRWLTTLGILALCGSARAGAETSAQTQAEFRQLEQAMFQAVVARDLAAIGRIWADDVVSTNADATVTNKAQWIEAIRSGAWPPVDDIRSSDFQLRRFGDTAIITGRSDYLIKGQLLGAVRHTQVWLKRRAQWQMVSWQGTYIPPAAPAQTAGAAASAPAAWPTPAAPPQHPGYDKLQMFVGDWTIEGREKTYLEKCDWFEGRFQVVCHTESKRSDGSVGRSISILGYLPEEDAYTYSGIGSGGRNETMRGAFTGSTLEFLGQSRDGGKLVKSRVTITPAGRDFTLRSTTSTDSGPWIVDGTFQYKLLR